MKGMRDNTVVYLWLKFLKLPLFFYFKYFTFIHVVVAQILFCYV